ncbi:DUF883 domain-containing protein [Pseudoalteromonas sp. YIC-656]|uniref:DUF883 domain-containing protein n=1 Tax=Pseudoalteromonas pernae TaxID=3118054 RepID=UPI003242C7AC
MSTKQSTTKDTESHAPTTEQAAKVAHETIDKVAHKAADAEQYVRTHAQQSKESISQQKEQLEQSLQDSIDRTKAFAKENPLLCAGLAFVAGMIFTALMRRR